MFVRSRATEICREQAGKKAMVRTASPKITLACHAILDQTLSTLAETDFGSLSVFIFRSVAPSSRRRSHQRSRKSGISEAAKKNGPPRRWMTLLIISGPMCTHSSDITKIRKPLRKRPNGITAPTNSARRHLVRKNMFAANKLVITKTRLDLMPLHSLATVIVIPGS